MIDQGLNKWQRKNVKQYFTSCDWNRSRYWTEVRCGPWARTRRWKQLLQWSILHIADGSSLQLWTSPVLHCNPKTPTNSSKEILFSVLWFFSCSIKYLQRLNSNLRSDF